MRRDGEAAQPLRRGVLLRCALAACAGLLAVAVTLGGALRAGDQATETLREESRARLEEIATAVSRHLVHGLDERYARIMATTRLASQAEMMADADQARRWLEALQELHPDFLWIGVTDPGGRVRIATRRMLEGVDAAGRPWVAGAQQAPYLGDLHEAQLLGSLLPPRTDAEPWRFLDIAAPIRARDGTALGVLGAHLGLDWAAHTLQMSLTPGRRREGIGLLLLDAQGRIVIGPPGSVGAPAAEAMPAGVIVATARAKAQPEVAGLDWQVLAYQDSATALAPAMALRSGLLAAGIAAGLAAAVAAWRSAGRLAPPLGRLAGALRAGRVAAALQALGQDAATGGNAPDGPGRTVESLRREAAEAHAAAARADQDKAELLDLVADALRTHLGGILGMAELLERRLGQDAELQHYARRQREAGHDLKRILDDILVHVHLGAGRLVLHPRPFDPAALLRAASGLQARAAQAKGLWLDLAGEAGLPALLLGDRDRIGQILAQLLSHAVTVADTGGVAVRAGWAPAGDGHGLLRIAVTHGGPGIAPADQHRLFSLLDGTPPSPGLQPGCPCAGLAAARKLAMLMGGSLELEGIAGQKCTLALPLGTPDAARDRGRRDLAPLASAGAA